MRFDVPELDIDKRILREPLQLTPRHKIERRVVWNLCDHLHRAGFDIRGVYDGEEYTKVSTAKDAMELIFDLDEASLRVAKSGYAEHGILLVMGNGEDILSDWNFFRDDRDGFCAAMNAFAANIEELF